MPWVRLDEGFPEHPKVVEVGGDAAWLHVCALAYCNRNLTDGKITESALPRLSDRRQPAKLARMLVAVGLWDQVDGGWVIHDFLDYQPSRAKVEGERRAARERMANNRARSGNVRPNIDRSSPYTDTDTDPIPSEQVPAPPPVSDPPADGAGGLRWINQVMLTAAEQLYALEPAGSISNRAGWVHKVAQRLLAEHGPWTQRHFAGRSVEHAANEVSGKDRGLNMPGRPVDDSAAGRRYGLAVGAAHLEDGMADRSAVCAEIADRSDVFQRAAIDAYDETVRPLLDGGGADVIELRRTP